MPQLSGTQLVNRSTAHAKLKEVAWKEGVVAASIANVNVAAAPASIDGIALIASDRVLLKNQTVATENGIYTFAGAGVPLVRATDANTDNELDNAVTTIHGGTVNAYRLYRQTTDNAISGSPVWSSVRPVSEAGVPAVTSDAAHGFFVGDQWWDSTGRKLYVSKDQSNGAASWDQMFNATTGGTISGDVVLTGNITMPEDGWIGIGATAERIVFDGSGDFINFTATGVYVNTAEKQFRMASQGTAFTASAVGSTVSDSVRDDAITWGYNVTAPFLSVADVRINNAEPALQITLEANYKVPAGANQMEWNLDYMSANGLTYRRGFTYVVDRATHVQTWGFKGAVFDFTDNATATSTLYINTVQRMVGVNGAPGYGTLHVQATRAANEQVVVHETTGSYHTGIAFTQTGNPLTDTRAWGFYGGANSYITGTAYLTALALSDNVPGFAIQKHANLNGGLTATMLYVDNANNRVGIGTATTTEKLTVAGNIAIQEDAWIGIGAAAERIVFDGTGNHIDVMHEDADAGMRWYSGANLLAEVRRYSAGYSTSTSWYYPVDYSIYINSQLISAFGGTGQWLYSTYKTNYRDSTIWINSANDGYLDFVADTGMRATTPGFLVGSASDGVNLTYIAGWGEILGIDVGGAGWNGLKLRTGARDDLCIATTGYVGVGTSAPGFKISVVAPTVESLQYAIAVRNPWGASSTQAVGILFGNSPSDTEFFKGGIAYTRASDGWSRGNFHILQNSAASTANAALTDAVFTVTNAGGVGIGTPTVPHGGIGAAKLAIEGTNASTAGPHVQFTTASDDYPLMQILPYSHDIVSIAFDAYWKSDGSWNSADAGSNFQIYKINDTLNFNAKGGVAAGNGLTFITAFQIEPDGDVMFSPAAALKTYWRDSAIWINSETDGHLNLAADVSVDVSTLLDVTGSVYSHVAVRANNFYQYSSSDTLFGNDAAGKGINFYFAGATHLSGKSDGNFLLATTTQWQFRDTAIYLASLNDGYLDIAADIEIRTTSPVMTITSAGEYTGISINGASANKAYLIIRDASNECVIHGVNGGYDQYVIGSGNSSGRQFVFCHAGWWVRDFDHDMPTNPTVYFQDVSDPDISNNKYGYIYHDSTGLVIASGPNIGVGTVPATIDNYMRFAPRGTLTFELTGAGSVVAGAQAALATNATDGFLYVPTCAGTPTGVPTAYTGKVALVMDTVNGLLYMYNGGWIAVELA